MALKNKLIDLNNHLFAQLERLSEEGLKGDKLTEEIDRSKAVCGVASQIVGNARLALDAKIAINERMIPKLPGMIEHEPSETIHKKTTKISSR